MKNKSLADDDEAAVLVEDREVDTKPLPNVPVSPANTHGCRVFGFVIVIFIVLALVAARKQDFEGFFRDEDSPNDSKKLIPTESPSIGSEVDRVPGPTPPESQPQEGEDDERFVDNENDEEHFEIEEDDSEILQAAQEELDVSDGDEGENPDNPSKEQLDEIGDGDDSDEPSDIPSAQEAESIKTYLEGDAEDALSEAEQDSQNALSGKGVAPRTTSEPYNFIDPNEKYVVYNPGGGMSNQELELVNALRMAKAISRKLYVPMVGKHANQPAGYLRLKLDELFPADRIYDFGIMNSFTPVLPLNMTLRKFVSHFAEVNGPNHLRFVLTGFGFDGRAVARTLLRMNQKLIIFSGGAMWGRWWPPAERKFTRRHLAYSPHLRRIAVNIARASIGERFYAIHGRLGDEAYRWEGADSGDAFVKTHQFRTWNKSLPVYLASDDPKNTFFAPLKARAKTITSFDLHGPEVDTFRTLFPSHRVRMDMFGVLDKLLCALAADFMGSPFSTFSLEIRMMRGQTKFVFPEAYSLKHSNGTDLIEP